MPSWNPNWVNVQFDHAAASAAAAACRSTAATLQDVTTVVGGSRAVATEDWIGPHADDFDREEPVVMSELRDTRSALVGLASRIERAAAAALTEQARRVDERDRWRRERDAEEAES